MEKTRLLFKKIRNTKGTFHSQMGTIKDRNGMDLTEADDIKRRWEEYATGDRDQIIPKKKKCKKAKWLSEEALQIAVKRSEAKSKRQNERYTHLNAEFQRIARR